VHHPISDIQALILGLLQGAAELFPVSSLGHSVILPRLFGWNIHQNDDSFLTFLVATHLATALVLLGNFWRDWVRILRGLGRSIAARELDPDDADARLGWLLVMGTVPAGILGLALEHVLRTVFASATAAAFFLFCNGLMLFAAERARRHAPVRQTSEYGDERLARELSFRSALGIGAAQAIALLPGFSRSGASMSGGLLAGLSNEDSARFAFLLATPVIGLAALLKLPDLLGSQGADVRSAALIGALGAAASAWLATRFLLRYFETNRLTPFAIYCTVVGAVLTVVFLAT